ncbi:MAG: hypothetical protein DWQ47_15070 [Acidobacteria bacterium]|nr:MAG: hypothetical protein DWQ32_02470 [Acidobacteriota bacterium]REK02614.1 MAG: hypothetical protein DWQ38_09665 [Acidobacteriota bacterium]REK13583.1 MAG: hypothetical protein DWQ43_08160 [Acidobacteriota bacterium]REK41577.1 MAG: hypothetical protein DWQ47_15070 [Acidobacteriota bacterium]
MSTSIHEIHRSVADAENLESVHDEEISVGDVVLSLLQHPLQIITRWNWKSALMGAVLRASFYFTVYKASKETWLVTMTAVLVELLFRFFTSGISGALVQSFRRAKPAWLATLIVSVSLPVFSHSVEFVTHYAQEAYFSNVFAPSINNARERAFAVSVLVSVISAIFNIFIMRHGVLLVGAGEDTKSLWGDLKSVPWLVIQFVAFLPSQILRFIDRGQFLHAAGIFLSFGLVIGTLMGTFRGKWSWAFATSLGSWAILLSFTMLVFAVETIYRKYFKRV